MADEAQTAPPQLGSTLLAIAQVHAKQMPTPASSGCAAIDEVSLEGGYRYGEITSIAGDTGTGKTLLVYHAAASQLLSFPSSEVALIDTTGSFSPFRLRDVLAFRLRARLQQIRYQHAGYMYERTGPNANNTNDTEVVEEATSMLDRVKVMRVFDFAGMVEAFGEVSEKIDEFSSMKTASRASTEQEKHEICDSEDELEDEDDLPVGEGTANPLDRQIEQIGMIIIDTITNPVSSAMSKSHVQGQALLASFMRSLGHLTRRHHVCTILTNAAVGLNRSQNPDHQRRSADNVSIFASTLGRPALGKAFSYLIDTSIFLSAVPKSRNDAAIAYGERPPGQTWQEASVLEVLKDRCGSREGRWMAFQINSDVKLVPCYV